MLPSVYLCTNADRGSSLKNGLIFFLEMAATDKSVQKRNPAGTPQEPRNSERPEKPRNGAGFSGMSHTMNPTEEKRRNPTKPVSGNPVRDTPPTRGRAREAVMPACIPTDAWNAYQDVIEIKYGGIFSIPQTLALWRELAAMDREGYDPEKVLNRAAAHGFRTFDRLEEMKKTPAGGNQSPGLIGSNQRSNYGPQKSKQQHPDGASEFAEKYAGILQ